MTTMLCEICGAPAVSEFASLRRGPSCLRHANPSYQLGALAAMTELLVACVEREAPLDCYGLHQLAPRVALILDALTPDYRRVSTMTPPAAASAVMGAAIETTTTT